MDTSHRRRGYTHKRFVSNYTTSHRHREETRGSTWLHPNSHIDKEMTTLYIDVPMDTQHRSTGSLHLKANPVLCACHIPNTMDSDTFSSGPKIPSQVFMLHTDNGGGAKLPSVQPLDVLHKTNIHSAPRVQTLLEVWVKGFSNQARMLLSGSKYSPGWRHWFLSRAAPHKPAHRHSRKPATLGLR